jgi:hypothetical protein
MKPSAFQHTTVIIYALHKLKQECRTENRIIIWQKTNHTSALLTERTEMMHGESHELLHKQLFCSDNILTPI